LAREKFAGRGAERIELIRDASGTVFVDRELAALAIGQVLDNALKYGQPGTPVRCEIVADDRAEIIRITDQGSGIPERERERIFDKFYRRSPFRSQVPGSGLGLHIAREIARIHGGDLWVEGAEPRGSTFCFRLPVSTGVKT
jgi:signal transduction histidine kinase